MIDHRRFRWILVFAVILLAGQPARASNELVISCHGTESGGPGATRYEYFLFNPSSSNVGVEYFYVGTDDLNATHYTNWTAPTGFASAATVADWTTLDATFGTTFSVMYTTGVKTAHGVVPPAGGPPTAGGIVWPCVNPPCTLIIQRNWRFGFDNPNPSQDTEWLVDQVVGTSQGSPTNPMAGYLSNNRGWIHAPVSAEPVPSTGAVGMFLLALLLASGLAYWESRSRNRAGA